MPGGNPIEEYLMECETNAVKIYLDMDLLAVPTGIELLPIGMFVSVWTMHGNCHFLVLLNSHESWEHVSEDTGNAIRFSKTWLSELSEKAAMQTDVHPLIYFLEDLGNDIVGDLVRLDIPDELYKSIQDSLHRLDFKTWLKKGFYTALAFFTHKQYSLGTFEDVSAPRELNQLLDKLACDNCNAVPYV